MVLLVWNRLFKHLYIKKQSCCIVAFLVTICTYAPLYPKWELNYWSCEMDVLITWLRVWNLANVASEPPSEVTAKYMQPLFSANSNKTYSSKLLRFLMPKWVNDFHPYYI